MKINIVENIDDYDTSMKCLLIGKKGVGKSTLLVRMLENTFTPQVETVSIEFSSVCLQAVPLFKANVNKRGIVIKLQMWDASGDEKYKNIIGNYFDGAQIVFFVFDMNDVSSLSYVVEWAETLKLKGINADNTLFILIGNKLDMLGDQSLNRQVMSNNIGKNLRFSPYLF